MARITETLTVPAPVDEAFRLVADFTSTRRWDPGIRAARRLDDGPLGLGARFEVQLGLGPVALPLVYEITTYDHPHHLVLTTRGPAHHGRDDVSFRPDGGGTTIVWDAQFALRGPGGLLDPLLAIGFRRAARDAVSGLAAALGGRTDTG